MTACRRFAFVYLAINTIHAAMSNIHQINIDLSRKKL